MNQHWHLFIGNLAVVGLAISLWVHVATLCKKITPVSENLVLGLALGLATGATMELGIELRPGAFVDLRSALLALAAFFGGPPASAVALTIGIAWRIFLGGSGMLDGLWGMGVMSAIGLIGFFATRRRKVKVIHLLALAGVISIAVLIRLVTVKTLLETNALDNVGKQMLALNFATVIVIGIAILAVRARETETRLLRAALDQAPDYLYVKDRNSRFMLANSNMADLYNVVDPNALIGMSNSSLEPMPIAEQHYEDEQEIMRSGGSKTGVVEHIGARIFRTSRVPIRDQRGAVIGLVGGMRDITDSMRMSNELRVTGNRLNHVLLGMSDGFAVFGRDGALHMFNQQFRDIFTRTGSQMVIGQKTIGIVRASLREKEFESDTLGGKPHWLRLFIAAINENTELEFRSCEGRWFSARIRWSNEQAVIVVSDISSAKRAEDKLRQSAMQLRDLAETDPLSQVANRRAFDAVLQEYGGSGNLLSVLMADIDSFKAYNDTYGHQAGDKCLKAVATSLREVADRFGGYTARYGGEEFVVLLPGKEEPEAQAIAEEMLDEIRGHCIPHRGSQVGFVTISIGVASAMGRTAAIDTEGLIRRADTALYAAKANGRNRSQSWRQHDWQGKSKQVG